MFGSKYLDKNLKHRRVIWVGTDADFPDDFLYRAEAVIDRVEVFDGLSQA